MTYRMFWGEAVPSRTKKNKVLVLNLFTRTHVTILNIKNWFSKLSIKMEKEKTRKTKEKNQKEEPERKRPMFTKCFLALRRRYLVKDFFIFMSDSCVRYEVGFVRYNSENVWCLVLLFSLVICKLFDWSKFVYSYIHIKKIPKYQHVWGSADLHFWYDVWVTTAAFLINFLGKSLILNFLKM